MKGPQPLIDLRSDTVTQPTAEMRRAMAEASVGDDVYEEDPTVRRLEGRAAEILGTEAALFVPTGTMGNQIALRLLARPGEEVICEASSHIVQYELGAMAAISGLLPRTVPGQRGRLTPEAVRERLWRRDPLKARTGALVLENTTNLGGGAVYTTAEGAALQEVAKSRGVPVHLDGARLFNAAVALGVEVHELARGFDTVMVSLSKGLGAPVGSLLAGPRERMVEARRVRKMLGGGMRQVGVLAAAGELALIEGPRNLALDHEHARLLVKAAVGLPEWKTEPVETNIVVLRWRGRATGAEMPAQQLVERLRQGGVLATALDGTTVRFVTHRDLSTEVVTGAANLLRLLSA